MSRRPREKRKKDAAPKAQKGPSTLSKLLARVSALLPAAKTVGSGENGGALDAGGQAAANRTRQKNRKITYSIIGLFAVLILIALFSCDTAPKGGLAYALCATFAERLVPFPPTITVNGLEQGRKATRVYYTHTDAFGQFRQEMLDCEFGTDAEGRTIMTRVELNRRPVPEEEIESFNSVLGAVAQSDPDQTLPGRRVNPLAPKK